MHILGSRALVPYHAGLAKTLTIKSRFVDDDGTRKTVEAFERYGDRMWVPRGVVRESPETDSRVVFGASPLAPAKPPRTDEQAQMIDKSVGLLQMGQSHILEAPTGFGKTYIGSAIACKIGQPTLIVVTKSDLMQSWRETLLGLIGLPESQIGIAQADKLKYKGCRFVLGMMHSLARPEKYDQEFLRNFGMVIFDEVHRLGAEHFNVVAGMFPAMYRLGLSADSNRSDGMSDLFKLHIGPVMVRGQSVPMKPRILVRKTGWKLPTVIRTVDNPNGPGKIKKRVPLPHSPGRMMPVSVAMAADIQRNQEIVNFVAQAYKAGRRTVVMSDLIDGHLKPLFKLLAGAGIPGEHMDYYISGRKPVELESAARKPVVLVTYGMASEGTDYPEWDTLVMATPRGNVKQAVGRVLRSKPGKPIPVVLDLVDDVEVLKTFYQSREKYYYQVGAEIVRM